MSKHPIYETSVMPMMNIALFLSREEVETFYKQRKAEYSDIRDDLLGAPAQTWAAEFSGRKTSCVLLEMGDDDTPMASILAVLAHEATHVAQHWLSWIGETDPAEEELAYAVQAATQVLYDDYFERLKNDIRVR